MQWILNIFTLLNFLFYSEIFRIVKTFLNLRTVSIQQKFEGDRDPFCECMTTLAHIWHS